MDNKFPLVPCNIRDAWDEIAPGLSEIKHKWPLACTWRLEDVYAKVLYGDAVLYKTEDGFAICATETDEYNGKTDFFVWIAYAPEHKRGGMLKKYWPSFIEVARSLGCEGVSMGSLHPALNAFLPLRPVYTRYRYEIPEEARSNSRRDSA